MTVSDQPAPAPPIERPTKLRWGCVGLLSLGGVLVGGTVLAMLARSPRCSGAVSASGLQASGIFKAMMLYALDHDGKFPSAETNSNQAFRQLFPDYMEDEKNFYVFRSAWHDAMPNKRPDGNIGNRPDYAQRLERGENHWAYVSGLDATSPASLPIIADGFVENEPGTYTDDPAKKGGVSKGLEAWVVFMDGSSKHIPLSKKTKFRVFRTDPETGKSVDIFTREGGLPENARVLNPE